MQEDSNLKLLLYRLALLIPDRWYVMAKYYKNFGKLPNLKHPITFNEKLQWLKLHDRRPEYTRMVDKYEAKNYVAEIIGDEYIEVNVFDEYKEKGAYSCYSDIFGFCLYEPEIEISSNIDTSKLGDYTVNYTISSSFHQKQIQRVLHCGR